MKSIAVIPARMGSSRYPGKPMEKILGLPMIGHVYLRTKLCKDLSETYVATCDEEIKSYIESIGGKAVMTADSHERCTDRVSEALLKIEKIEKITYDTVVIVQGDEPMVTPKMISSALGAFSGSGAPVLNLMKKFDSYEEATDPNEVKVVFNRKNEALYFSREAIPSHKKYKLDFPVYKQVCIMPFTRSFLFKFSELEPTPLEIIESVDMMRVLEHGEKVKLVEIDEPVYSVDTREDLVFVEGEMKKDQLFKQYAKQYLGDKFV